VGLDQLPAAVRQTLEASEQRGPVKEITRRVVDGRTIYTIEIDKKFAPNPHLRIAEDGALVRDPVTPYVGSGDMPIAVPEYTDASPVVRWTLSDLPVAAQKTVQKEAAGREIATIDRASREGRTVYEIEFKERGRNSRIHVAEDGALLPGDAPPRGPGALLTGTRLKDTPAAVQQTLRRLAGDQEIADIDRRGTGDEMFFRVEIRGGRGSRELRIAPDGRVIFDSHDTAAPRRTP
jgi:hypothetical protein